MKNVVVSIDGIMSICDGFGIEKRLLNYSGIQSIEANFLSGTATVKYDGSKVTLEEIKKLRKVNIWRKTSTMHQINTDYEEYGFKLSIRRGLMNYFLAFFDFIS